MRKITTRSAAPMTMATAIAAGALSGRHMLCIAAFGGVIGAVFWAASTLLG